MKNSPILDEIDTVLAEHYGFSSEELDFILNYDIKTASAAARRTRIDFLTRLIFVQKVIVQLLCPSDNSYIALSFT